MTDATASDSSITSTARYSTRYEADGESTITLIASIRPLLRQLPVQCRLILAAAPVTAPWPLVRISQSPEDQPLAHDKKRRRTEGDLRVWLNNMEERLRQDIPVALQSLAKHKASGGWIGDVLTPDNVVIITKNDRLWKQSWVTLEAQSIIEGAETALYLQKDEHICIHVEDLLHRLVAQENRDNLEIRCRVDRETTRKITMPPRSAFLVTDLLRDQSRLPSGWQTVLSFASKHPPALILMDPPYPSYSASRLNKRQERYHPVTDLYELWKMKESVQTLLDQGSAAYREGVLVGCWVTNNAKVIKFVLTKLFPAWKLIHVGQLVWIKVTAGDEKNTGGQLVFPIDNKQGRKPYELLLLGRTTSRPDDSPQHTELFASVPLGHSRKPPVFDLLRRRLLDISPERDLNVFELFARSLTSGPSPTSHWISVGNEPVAFNQAGIAYQRIQ